MVKQVIRAGPVKVEFPRVFGHIEFVVAISCDILTLMNHHHKFNVKSEKLLPITWVSCVDG